jgi:hypothetical protein
MSFLAVQFAVAVLFHVFRISAGRIGTKVIHRISHIWQPVTCQDGQYLSFLGVMGYASAGSNDLCCD